MCFHTVYIVSWSYYVRLGSPVLAPCAAPPGHGPQQRAHGDVGRGTPAGSGAGPGRHPETDKPRQRRRLVHFRLRGRRRLLQDRDPRRAGQREGNVWLRGREWLAEASLVLGQQRHGLQGRGPYDDCSGAWRRGAAPSDHREIPQARQPHASPCAASVRAENHRRHHRPQLRPAYSFTTTWCHTSKN